MTATDPYVDWDASYVLGALNAAERREFEQHVRECTDCQAAVAHLAGMPGVLAKVATSDAQAMGADSAPQPDRQGVRDLARAIVHRRTRRRRWATAVLAAAAALLFSGGVVLGTGPTMPQPQGAPAPGTVGEMSDPVLLASVGGSSVTGSVRLVAQPWGTQLAWSCDYGEGWSSTSYPQAYSLLITDATGAQTVVGTWAATGAHTTGLSASTSVTTVRSVEIRRANSTEVLASAEL